MSRDEIERAVPGLYEAFDALAQERIRRGYRHWSSDAIFHILRWQGWGGGRVLNDHLTAAVARVWIEENPEHEGFFELRCSRFDRVGDQRQADLFGAGA